MNSRRMRRAKNAARKDVLAGAIVIAAIIMFIGTGSSALTEVVQQLSGFGGGTDRFLNITVILNIALILFGGGVTVSSQPK